MHQFYKVELKKIEYIQVRFLAYATHVYAVIFLLTNLGNNVTSILGSVTRVGDISPFGRYFLAPVAISY
jgi:hypothetical protein